MSTAARRGTFINGTGVEFPGNVIVTVCDVRTSEPAVVATMGWPVEERR
jgi:hypothetical protein